MGAYEKKAIYKLALKLGFHENITKDFIELMKIYPMQRVPADVMLAI